MSEEKKLYSNLITMPEFLLEGLWKTPKDSGYSTLGGD